MTISKVASGECARQADVIKCCKTYFSAILVTIVQKITSMPRAVHNETKYNSNTYMGSPSLTEKQKCNSNCNLSVLGGQVKFHKNIHNVKILKY